MDEPIIITMPTEQELEQARNSPFYKGYIAGRRSAYNDIKYIFDKYQDEPYWESDTVQNKIEEWLKNNA